MTTTVTVAADDFSALGAGPSAGTQFIFNLVHVAIDGVTDRVTSTKAYAITLDNTGAGTAVIPDAKIGNGLAIWSTIAGWQYVYVANYPSGTLSLTDLVNGFQVDPATLAPSTAPASWNVLLTSLTARVAALEAGGGGGAVSSVAGRTGAVVLTKGDVGLSNVDNTADVSKPVSTAQAAAVAAALSSSAQRASNLSDLTNAATARTNLGLGSAATAASTAFDTAGAAAAAQTAAQSFATSAVATETSRATTAEGVNAAGIASLALTPTVVKTTTYTAAPQDLVLCDATGGPFTVTLPSAPADKTLIEIKKIDTSTNTVTFVTGGTDVFNRVGGATTGTLVLTGQSVTARYQASTGIWIVLTTDTPLAGLDTRFTPKTAQRAILATMAGSMAPAGARVSWYRNAQVTNLIGGTNRLFIPIPDPTQETFLPIFANFFGEEVVGANPITVAVSLEASNNTRMPYTFGGGNHTAVIQPGGFVTPDNALSTPQVSVSYSAGAGTGTVSGVWIWVYIQVASGQAIPLNVAIPLNGGEVDGLSTTGGPDRTLQGSGAAVAGNNANGYTFGPVAMLGTSKTARIFGAIGDSLLQGHGDTPDYIGYMNRAGIATQTAILNVAVSGERALDFATVSARARRTAELNGITDLFINLGVNDLNTGQSVAQLQANLTTIYGWATNLGIRVHAFTITPLTTSTDAWATTGNQTPVISAGTLSSINTWLRGLPAGIYACHDIGAVVSTGVDSGVWKAAYTTDGIHPAAAIHQGALATDLATYITTYKSSGAWLQ